MKKTRRTAGKKPARNTCTMVIERISEYIDGELPESFCDEVEKHIVECPECGTSVETMRKVITVCREISLVKVPAEKHRKLLRKIRELK